jgi:ubiquinone/menaquinone biosynthesis C-methylase UbiE
MGSLAYHELELAIAQNRGDPAHNLPSLPATYERILDVGCGHGQTLKALGVPVEKGYGIDLSVPDSEYFLVAGKGESLPFPDQHFDFVYSRVSLPYMHIHSALCEMRRVLKPGGQVWLSLHGFGYLRRRIFKSVLKLDLRDLIFCGYYVTVNSLLFHLFGVTTPWTQDSWESVQTERGIKIALRRAGFQHIEVRRTKFFEVTGS